MKLHRRPGKPQALKSIFLAVLIAAVFMTSGALKIHAQESDKPVDLDVRDADLRQVLQQLATKANINIILSPKVKGTITCRVKDVDPKELICFIARTNGLEIEDHGHVLLILTEDLPHTNVHFEIIPLQNANAADTAKMIQSLKLDKHAKVTHDARTNRLIVIYEY